MNSLKPPPIMAIVRRMADASETRARKIAKLRETIAAGNYRVSAAKVAEAQMKSTER